MNTRLRFFFALSALFVAAINPAPAQTQDESTRLMQEYMARRAEWVELRKAALEKVKAEKDEKEKKKQKDKLAEDEKPYLARMADAARAYKAVEKARRDQEAANKPRS